MVLSIFPVFGSHNRSLILRFPDSDYQEIFARELRSCYKDKFPSVPDFARHAQSVLQAVEVRAGQPVPSYERLMVLHVLTQLSINNFCPWAPALLANYRAAYRSVQLAQAVPEGYKLVDLVRTVVEHTAMYSGARDAGRFTDRPLCTSCNRYGHVAASCRSGRPASEQQRKGAATGPGRGEARGRRARRPPLHRWPQQAPAEPEGRANHR